MSATIGNMLLRLPLPQFGSTPTLLQWGKHSARSARAQVFMGLPAFIFGTWLIWPAVDTEWKISMGFEKDPKELEEKVEAVKKGLIKYDAAATTAIDNAYKLSAPTADDIAISKAIAAGDFSALEKEWDAFAMKSVIPGEDDDDDDDDDDEDDEDDEEEEEEEDEE